MASLAELLRNRVRAGLSGANANDFEAAAQRRAQAAAMSIGAGAPGVSPLAALRNAQQAGARASVDAAAEAARLRAAEQGNAMQLAAQLAQQEQARGDRFLGAGLAAGASGLGSLISMFGGERERRFVGPDDVAAQPGVQALRQSRPTRLPQAAETSQTTTLLGYPDPAALQLQAPAPAPAAAPEEEDPLAALTGTAPAIAGAVNPLAGLGLGALMNIGGRLG